MSDDGGSNTESSGKDFPDGGFSLTRNPTLSVNEEWNEAAFELPSDPRLIAFVIAFACWLADKDYDRLVDEGKQPCERNDDDD